LSRSKGWTRSLAQIALCYNAAACVQTAKGLGTLMIGTTMRKLAGLWLAVNFAGAAAQAQDAGRKYINVASRLLNGDD